MIYFHVINQNKLINQHAKKLDVTNHVIMKKDDIMIFAKEIVQGVQQYISMTATICIMNLQIFMKVILSTLIHQERCMILQIVKMDH